MLRGNYGEGMEYPDKLASHLAGTTGWERHRSKSWAIASFEVGVKVEPARSFLRTGEISLQKLRSNCDTFFLSTGSDARDALHRRLSWQPLGTGCKS